MSNYIGRVHCLRGGAFYNPHLEPIRVPDEVGKVTYQFLKSQMFLSGFKISTAAYLMLMTIGIAAIITLGGAYVMVPLAAAVGALLFLYLIGEIVQQRKQLAFELSLAWTLRKDKHYWSRISNQITLGGMPLANHIPRLKALGVSTIFNFLEDFELQTHFITPVTPEMAKKHKFKVHRQPLQDFFGVSPQDINRAIEALHREILAGKNVYIHCKAGRGRSATIVAAYLLKYGLADKKFNNPKTAVNDVIDFMKGLRPQISLKRNPLQYTALHNWYNLEMTKKGIPN